MKRLRAHFDGKVLVPEGPVDLPTGRVLEIQVEDVEDKPAGILSELATWAATLPQDPKSPTDAAAQHDHYLYGTPKKP
jgi:hypothetical protein